MICSDSTPPPAGSIWHHLRTAGSELIDFAAKVVAIARTGPGHVPIFADAGGPTCCGSLPGIGRL